MSIKQLDLQRFRLRCDCGAEFPTPGTPLYDNATKLWVRAEAAGWTATDCPDCAAKKPLTNYTVRYERRIIELTEVEVEATCPDHAEDLADKMLGHGLSQPGSRAKWEVHATGEPAVQFVRKHAG